MHAEKGILTQAWSPIGGITAAASAVLLRWEGD